MEQKRKEAVWDLFQSESNFLRHHLMALKNVSFIYNLLNHAQLILKSKLLIESLIKYQQIASEI